MKIYNPNQIENTIWQNIEHIFWSNIPLEVLTEDNFGREVVINQTREIENFMSGHAFDGLVPHIIKTDNAGMQIQGQYWVLPKCEKFNIEIRLRKPCFNSIQSLTVKKIAQASVASYSVNVVEKRTYIELKCG
jgi:hypothetical protein